MTRVSTASAASRPRLTARSTAVSGRGPAGAGGEHPQRQHGHREQLPEPAAGVLGVGQAGGAQRRARPSRTAPRTARRRTARTAATSSPVGSAQSRQRSRVGRGRACGIGCGRREQQEAGAGGGQRRRARTGRSSRVTEPPSIAGSDRGRRHRRTPRRPRPAAARTPAARPARPARPRRPAAATGARCPPRSPRREPGHRPQRREAERAQAGPPGTGRSAPPRPATRRGGGQQAQRGQPLRRAHRAHCGQRDRRGDPADVRDRDRGWCSARRRPRASAIATAVESTTATAENQPMPVGPVGRARRHRDPGRRDGAEQGLRGRPGRPRPPVAEDRRRCRAAGPSRRGRTCTAPAACSGPAVTTPLRAG